MQRPPGAPGGYPPAINPSQQQHGAPPGHAPLARPAGPQPGYMPHTNGVGAAAPVAPGAQQLAGHMQQLKLGGGPPGAAQRPVGPVPPARPAGVAPAARPPGMPLGQPGAPHGMANGVPMAPGIPAQRLAPPGQPGSLGGPAICPPGPAVPPGVPAAGARPAGMPPGVPAAGMRPPGVPPGVPAAGARPQGVPPGMRAAGMRPPGMPPGVPPPGVRAPSMPGVPPHGVGGPHPVGPPAVAGAAAAAVPPGGVMRPPGMGAPRPMGPMPPVGMAAPAAGAPGFGTPTKQLPTGAGTLSSPPPFSLKVGSNTPSPTKVARPPGGLVPPAGAVPPAPGFPQQQQQYAAAPGIRPPYGAPMAPGFPPQPPTAPGIAPLAPGYQQPPGLHHPPGPPHPGMPPAAPAAVASGGSSSSSKIDPSQIPRPLATPLPMQVFETRRENTHAIPPPADAPIVVKDHGSCGPRYLRSLLNMVPQTADLLKHSSLPFVVLVNPLALPDPGDDPIEVVDFGESGPVRCARCKAYVNPYFKFVDSGRKMQCNFCGFVGDCPPDYVCHLGPDGQRRDKYERPELCKGSVEMAATREYMVRPPMPPVHFFLIDVSHPAITTGATAAVCSSIAKILDELPGGERTQVCVATYDSSIHFYSLRAGQSQPHMLVVPDVTDVYCPLPGNVVVSLAESRALVDTLLESIPRMFAGTQVMETCAGAALRSAVEALKGGVGGKIHAFLSSLPRRGVLSLRQRDLGRPPTDRDPLEAMLPENKDYHALALDAAEHQVCVDLFFLAQGYCDVATLSQLPATTAGGIYHYAPFDPAQDADEFYNDLRWNVIRPQGLEAVGRLRASHGLTVDKYIGPYYKRTLTDLNFPAISSDHCIAAKLVHEEKLPETGEVYLQYALLYTTVAGERRIRVHTLALPVTHSLGTTFRGADLDVYMAYVAKKVASQIPGHALGACKEAINKSAIDALHAYRKQCASASSSGQLILPEALKLLPLYTLALTKTPCFRVDAKLDVRAVWMARLAAVPAQAIVPLIYPRLLPLHNLLERPEGAPLVPEKLWVSAEKLDPAGAYLLENGCEAFLFLGKAAPAELCMAILGLPSPDAVHDGPLQHLLLLPRLDNPLNKKIQQLLDEIRRQRTNYMRLRVVRRNDPVLEPAFFNALVEDRSPTGGMSYVEYLCFLHRQIQNKLS